MDKEERRRLLSQQPEIRELLGEIYTRRYHLVSLLLSTALSSNEALGRSYATGIEECDRVVASLGGKTLREALKEIHNAR